MNKQRLMVSLVLAMTAAAHAMPPDAQTKYPLPLNRDASDLAHTEAADTTQCPDACKSLNNQPSVISAADNTGTNTRDSMGQSRTPTSTSSNSTNTNSSSSYGTTNDTRAQGNQSSAGSAADNTGTNTRDSMGQSRTPTSSSSSNSSSSYGATNDTRVQGNQSSAGSAAGNTGTGTTTRESLGQPRTPTSSSSTNSSSSYGANNDNRVQGNQSSARSEADNTGKNTRDSTGQSITPINQSNSSADLKITADIRSALVDDKSLSTSAHNVKVITTNGSITLRGPVRNTQERERVLAIVKKFAGRYTINNYLEVTTR